MLVPVEMGSTGALVPAGAGSGGVSAETETAGPVPAELVTGSALPSVFAPFKASVSSIATWPTTCAQEGATQARNAQLAAARTDASPRS